MNTGQTGTVGFRGRWGGLPLLLFLAACTSDGTGASGTAGDPPHAVAMEPSPGSDGASVLTSITARFDQPLDVGSLSSVVTLQSGGHPLGGTAMLQGDRTLLFVPTSPLDFGDEYEVTVRGTLRDRDGDVMGSPLDWTFRTEGYALPAPAVLSLKSHVEDLADDSLRGRGSGTADEEVAAMYVASFFDDEGLAPLSGVRLQEFSALPGDGGDTITSQNVLGVVPGAGVLASEWIIVGAHYDHLGVKQSTGGSLEIFNGADDNASGTSAVMELGRTYGFYVTSEGMAERARRSVLFAAWGAEELGLLGSCHFAASGLLPLANVSAVVNLDMVGMLRSNSAEALGWESSIAWPGILADANRAEVHFDNSTICQSCSDHACFRRQGVPYLWFFTGWHDEYHTPQDDPPLLNYEGMARISDVALRVLVRLAVTEHPPVFRNGGG